MHSRITLSHTAFFNVHVSPTRATSLKHTRARTARAPSRARSRRSSGVHSVFDWICKQVAPGRVWDHMPGAAERQGSSHATADRRAVISGTAPLLPLLQLLLSSPLLHVRSRVQGCSQGHRSRVCVRQHTPVSGATVDKMHRPQLAAANHCSARWSGCCTLLAERLISSSSTGAPRAMPLAEHSVSEASRLVLA